MKPVSRTARILCDLRRGRQRSVYRRATKCAPTTVPSSFLGVLCSADGQPKSCRDGPGKTRPSTWPWLDERVMTGVGQGLCQGGGNLRACALWQHLMRHLRGESVDQPREDGRGAGTSDVQMTARRVQRWPGVTNPPRPANMARPLNQNRPTRFRSVPAGNESDGSSRDEKRMGEKIAPQGGVHSGAALAGGDPAPSIRAIAWRVARRKATRRALGGLPPCIQCRGCLSWGRSGTCSAKIMRGGQYLECGCAVPRPRWDKQHWRRKRRCCFGTW